MQDFSTLTQTNLASAVQAAVPLTPRQPLVILSPHLDDAIWSLGSMLQVLIKAGHPVRIVTIFSETTDVATRKQEDMDAAAAIGCQVVHLDFSDAILDGRPLEDVFDGTFVPSPAVVQEIVARLQPHLPDRAVIFAPSGFGEHVDHLLTRAVGAALPDNVVFYEDFPYAARTVRLDNAHAFLQSKSLHRASLHLDAAVVNEHIALYKLYASQSQVHHVAQITEHLTHRGYGLWL